MTKFRLMATWLSWFLILPTAVPHGARADDAPCRQLGNLPGGLETVALSELLENPDAYDGRLLVTEGFLWAEREGDQLCPERGPRSNGRQGAENCLRPVFSWEYLGGDQLAVRKWLEQRNGGRARLYGRFSASLRGMMDIYAAGLADVTALELLGEPAGRFYCLDEVDRMPPPESPHEFSGLFRYAHRCGDRAEDSEGQLVCLDRLEPWVWTESDGTFTRSLYTPPSEDFKLEVQELVPLGNGKFIAVVWDGPWYETASDKDEDILGEIGDLVAWDGTELVPLARDAVLWPYLIGGTMYYVDVDRDEAGKALASRVMGVDETLEPRVVWSRQGVEVTWLSGGNAPGQLMIDAECFDQMLTIDVGVEGDR